MSPHKIIFALLLYGLKAFAVAFLTMHSSAMAASFVLDIRWVRAHSTVSEVRDGVCVIYMADRSEQDLLVGQSQLEQCLATPGLRLPAEPPAGAQRVQVHLVKDSKELTAKFWELYRRGPQVTIDLAAFYLKEGGVCHVVIRPQRRDFGHELKHCFDGNFHDANHRWKDD